MTNTESLQELLADIHECASVNSGTILLNPYNIDNFPPPPVIKNAKISFTTLRVNSALMEYIADWTFIYFQKHNLDIWSCIRHYPPLCILTADSQTAGFVSTSDGGTRIE